MLGLVETAGFVCKVIGGHRPPLDSSGAYNKIKVWAQSTCKDTRLGKPFSGITVGTTQLDGAYIEQLHTERS